MAKITSYFGALNQEHTYTIRLASLPVTVGTCRYPDFNDYVVHCRGTAGVLGHKGPFDVTIELMDHDPTTQNGPAKVTSSGSVDNNAKYRVEGKTLVIETREMGGGPFVFSADGEATAVGTPSPEPDLRIVP